MTWQSNATARWYAHEKQVKKQPEEKRIHCFLPLYRSVCCWKYRHRELKLALFPGYVFVHVAPEDRLSVLQTPGVMHFVSFSVHPATLDDSEIESLRAGVANGVCAELYSYLKVGRTVRVKHGPMAGAEGILVRKKDSLRIVLSTDLIVRSVAVEVHAADLE